MDRVAAVVACWFAFWIGLFVVIGAHKAGLGGFYSGALTGAWVAALSSFLWPLIMPDAILRWMDGHR